MKMKKPAQKVLVGTLVVTGLLSGASCILLPTSKAYAAERLSNDNANVKKELLQKFAQSNISFINVDRIIHPIPADIQTVMNKDQQGEYGNVKEDLFFSVGHASS
ncbi:hypothetical protein [Bacillus cereus]|uniref:Uncharacterized protein n=1 Tax=Bacillus cereus TaxID=1396 RepID=A0A9X7B7H7_BACCE|nr:hypothetical protein [Bacillus cereus]PED43152.1 hypothetical protein CON26_15940 [Bacillus cereus]PFV02852.1 hypothetical protein COK98_25835 [Bacillus cereus]